MQKTKNNNTSQQNQKKNTNEGTKKKSVHKPKQQPANSEEEDSDIEKMSRVPHPKEEAKLNSNPLEIVFINGSITTCSGCNFKYKDSERREPYDLVFKMCMHHMRPFHRGTIWACVKSADDLEKRNISKKDIYMSNKTLFKMSPMHVCLLKELKYSPFIKHNREAIYIHKVNKY